MAPWLAEKAAEIGFDLCRVIPAGDLAPPDHLAEWLAQGFAGEMRYLHDPRRADPAGLLPEARSVIVCAVNYNPPAPYSTAAAARAALGDAPRAWISRYAWGQDYHLVVGEKLETLVAALRTRFGSDVTTRAYVDTGPISERMAAKLAGLGWLGKNTCLINRDIGSWLFLGVILTSLDPAALLPAGAAVASPAPDLCGNCTLCLDACPTGAIIEPYVLDARRCISYLTIELRDAIPEEFRSAMGWQVFGCDICQDVCPWNRPAPAASAPAFALAAEKSSANTQGSIVIPNPAPAQLDGDVGDGSALAFGRTRLQAPELLWLLSLSEDDFRVAFHGSAVRRAKWRGLLRNACVAAGNALRQPGSADAPARAAIKTQLAQLAASVDALIAEHARWALSQDAAQERHVVPSLEED